MTNEEAQNRAQWALNILDAWASAPSGSTKHLHAQLYDMIERSPDPAKIRSYFPDNDDVVIKQDLMEAELSEQGITPVNTF
jgi:hypothetical protein